MNSSSGGRVNSTNMGVGLRVWPVAQIAVWAIPTSPPFTTAKLSVADLSSFCGYPLECTAATNDIKDELKETTGGEFRVYRAP